MQPFHHLLINNLVANITNFTVWFAITFWIFLETQSVFATGMIAGIYLVLTGALGIWFGSLVDHHRKRSMMLVSSLVSLAIYTAALGAYALDPSIAAARVSSVSLWLFVLLTMLGVIVAWGGMVATLAFAITFSLIAALHLLLVSVDEPRDTDAHDDPRRIDLVGTFRIVTAIPGLFALILFAAFNNLLGGVFMALMDAYGLSLMKVEQWGLLWAFVSCAFILSGALIARTGLGANPVRTLLLVNLIVWAVAALFTVQSSILLLTVGCFIWLFLGPYAEAAEQTTLQKVVPFERQGRVFGFAQSVEQAASPLTAFLIAPLTQFIFVPLMTSGAGADLIGDWYGRGAERGIAIVFTITGILGVIATLAAFRSQSYRRISAAYAAGDTGADTPTPPQ